MEVRGTIIAATLLLIVAVIFWLDKPSSNAPSRPGTLANEQGGQDPTPTGPRLVDFQPGDVISLRLTMQNETRVTTRQNDTWSSTERRSLVDDFLNDLTTLGALANIDAGTDDLPLFGLQPARAVVDVQLRGRDVASVLLVGNRNPSATGVYIRLGREGKVVLAGALIDWELEKAFQSLAPAP